MTRAWCFVIVATAFAADDTPPPPTAAEQQALISQVRENALAYTKSLPNYICAQVTRRQIDPSGSGRWRTGDTILEQLRFLDAREQFTVVRVNNRSTNLRHDQLGGAISTGEFGGLLNAIFEADNHTEFTWQRWTQLRGRIMHVYTFRTGRPIYTVSYKKGKRIAHTHMRGSVFIDRDTKMTMRLQMECDNLPADFPMQEASIQLDYDFTDIAGQSFLLPLHSEARYREGRSGFWNLSSYGSYRKFGAEASISFENADVPPDRLKEEPVKKK